ncbi:MAG TPA: 6,7-dimethyl-8-ribityllumazine synthase [Vicinamibacterales bacterium]|nr:6,7-dimethyl-8-ribityllumazine synthase [Vicinamibacterales bacterium]
MRIIEGVRSPAGMTFAVVVSRYNDFVTDRLQKGALAALAHLGVRDEDVTLIRVPGAFEIPTAARLAAGTASFNGIVCLGCLIKGATPHFEYISSAVAHGLTAAAGATRVPMAFGVLTTNSAEEALERAVDGPSNKGWEAAQATVEMALIAAELAAGARAT